MVATIPQQVARALLALALTFGGIVGAGETRPQALFPDAAPVCSPADLLKVSLPNTTIDSAVTDPTDGSCRVTATVTHPPATDRVKIFIALPTQGWNGRFRGTGGGGFSGGNPKNLNALVAFGYAAGATDTGHEGGSGSFALDANGRLDWQAIRNNAYLGIHDMTVVGKALATAFYGKAPGRSYFVGSSTGGRQGMSEAQRFPDDYDGIVSACPAISWQLLSPTSLWPHVAMLAAGTVVSKAKLSAATAAAVEACDSLDGVTDGVIDDPTRCTYNPMALVGTKVGEEKFTAADAEVIRKIWEGPRSPDGTIIWHGIAPGTDLFALAGSEGSPLKGKPGGPPMDYLRYFLNQDPNWDWTTLTPARFEQSVLQSVEQYGAVLGTDNPDLTRFRDRGGRLILYHGLADQLVPAAGTIKYYQRVQERMGGGEKTAQFARLFLVPGVDHGFRGAGPGPIDPVGAIIRWVEEDQPPEKLHAELRGKDGKLIRSRPLFPYPQFAKYKGAGSTDDAANFVATTPPP